MSTPQIRCNVCDSVLTVIWNTDQDGAYAYVDPCHQCVQKAVNEAADVFQFVANEDMQIMENGYQAEEMAGHWISKYSKLVITA